MKIFLVIHIKLILINNKINNNMTIITNKENMDNLVYLNLKSYCICNNIKLINNVGKLDPKIFKQQSESLFPVFCKSIVMRWV